MTSVPLWLVSPRPKILLDSGHRRRYKDSVQIDRTRVAVSSQSSDVSEPHARRPRSRCPPPSHQSPPASPQTIERILEHLEHRASGVNSTNFGTPPPQKGLVLQGASQPDVPKMSDFWNMESCLRACYKNTKIRPLGRWPRQSQVTSHPNPFSCKTRGLEFRNSRAPASNPCPLRFNAGYPTVPNPRPTPETRHPTSLLSPSGKSRGFTKTPVIFGTSHESPCHFAPTALAPSRSISYPPSPF